MRVRVAVAADLPAIQATYAHHVLRGVGTFEEEPPDAAEMAARMTQGVAAGGCWLAAESDGALNGVVGFAYYGPYHPRSAYRFTVEDSVYVDEGARGTGIGTALLGGLVQRATAAGFRQMVAVIGSSDNAGSIALHARLGFTEAGVLRDVGLKFGRLLDVVLMQRTLD